LEHEAASKPEDARREDRFQTSWLSRTPRRSRICRAWELGHDDIVLFLIPNLNAERRGFMT